MWQTRARTTASERPWPRVPNEGGHTSRAVIAVAVMCTVVLGACGSSQNSSPSPGTCQDVSAVLSDGPDPAFDPVGYAEAQILPLQQIHTSDQQLVRALDELVTAFQHVVDTHGSSDAKRAATRAEDSVNALCPGAS
jgi:hypothetical protein